MKLSFTKMQGCANDYIYLDCRESGVPENIVPLAQDLSRRHFSVGADGIICICAPVTPGADGRMRIFNADGSEAGPGLAAAPLPHPHFQVGGVHHFHKLAALPLRARPGLP